jgi:threonine/homoserine/homoserine lactone efflux protein
VPTDNLAFLWISIVVIVTPGQDTALTIRNTLSSGRLGGLATAAGVATGQAVWALATSLGVAALIVASEPLFIALKLAGATYLLYLGGRALLSAIRGYERTAEDVGPTSHRTRPRVPFRQGVVSNLGNPKMAVFFTSLLPQFVPAGDGSFGSLLALGLVFCSMTFVWLAVYAIAVSRIGGFLRRPIIRRLMDAAIGVVFTYLGVRVAASAR